MKSIAEEEISELKENAVYIYISSFHFTPYKNISRAPFALA